jgi:hypothetical protein
MFAFSNGEGVVVRYSKTASTAEAIAVELASTCVPSRLWPRFAFETFSGRQDRRGERRSWAESTREGSLGAACDQLDEGRDTFSSARRSREAKIGLPTNSTSS